MTGENGRCRWCGTDPLYVAYHDQVWGRAQFDGRELFAKLCLDGQQAGLSWITILRKQPNYEALFHGFDPQRIAAFDGQDVERLLQEPGIVRNRLKVQSIIRNARALLAYEAGGGDFAALLWSFTGGRQLDGQCQPEGPFAATSPESDAMSKALKKLGFNFVGSTICYAFMQAVGMVNDHLTTCPSYAACRWDGQFEPALALLGGGVSK